MSVDISQLTARLDPERRDAVKTQYEARATNATATFLLCFFLGSAGAHRFYLREWRVAFAHLALFVLGAASLIAGLFQTLPLTTELTTHPVGAALDVVGALLLLAALIWEIIDLGRIDHQVYQRNLLLAEGIIAGTLLADPSVIEGARQKLDALTQKAHEQAHAGAAPAATATAAAAAGAGVITASEVADARALAEEAGGFSAISYTEVPKFDVSDVPDQTPQASVDAVHEGDWVESSTVTEQAPAATPDATPMTLTETETRTHTEDGPRVTDTYEVDRTAHPSVGEIAGLGAVGLGAAALGAGLVEATHGAGFDEPTQPDAASMVPEAAALAISEEPTTQAYTTEPYTSEAPTDEPTTQTTQMYAAPVTAPVTAPAYGAYANDRYGFDDDDVGDVTDASMPAVVVPAADIAVGSASPAFVQLPEEQAPTTPEAYTLDTPEDPDAPLYLIPEEPTADVYQYAPEPVDAPAYDAPAYDAPAYDAPASVEPPAEAYVPPVAPVFSAPTQAPPPPIPSWDQPTSVYSPAEPVAEPQPTHHDTLAEAAGVAGLAGAGALAGEALAHEHAPEPVAAEPVAAEPMAPPEPETIPESAAAAEPAAPEQPKMKKIRVRRKVVVDGQVVAEEVVEREVPADMDTAEAAAQIQAELGHLTPEQIAQRAHLAPDEEVELHQRTEGPEAGQ